MSRVRKQHEAEQAKINRKKKAAEIAQLLKASERNEYLSQHQQALVDAQYARDLAEEIYDEYDFGRVGPYVQLAAAQLSNDNTPVCEQLMTQVHWISIKQGSPLPATLEAKIHRTLGRLYLITSQPSTALAHFAEDIYFSSSAYGPMDPQCCGGYFYLSIVFEEHDTLRCLRFRRLVGRIWRRFLFQKFSKMVADTSKDGGNDLDDERRQQPLVDAGSEGEDEGEDVLDETLAAECQLHAQALYQQSCDGDEFDVVGCDASLSLILLALLSGDASVLKIKSLLGRISASPDPLAAEVKQQALFVDKHVSDALS